jgi:hypothetical protein
MYSLVIAEVKKRATGNMELKHGTLNPEHPEHETWNFEPQSGLHPSPPPPHYLIHRHAGGNGYIE